MRQLPPPISEHRNQHNINGASRLGLSSERAFAFIVGTLLHRASALCGRAFLCLLFLISLASCSNDEVHFVKISEYYAESCHLDQATQDSIVRFAQKVDAFVAANPLAKEDPLYARILHNIKTSSFDPTITINTDWDGETEIKF